MGEGLLWVLMMIMFNPKSKTYDTVTVHTFEKQQACRDAVRGLFYVRDNELASKRFLGGPNALVLADAWCVPLGKPEAIREAAELDR